MPFFTKYGASLLCAPECISVDGLEVTLETHADHQYPLGGWWWFDTQEAAEAALLLAVPPAEAAQIAPPLSVEAIAAKIQEFIDQQAADRGYGDEHTSATLSICSYIDDANPVFAGEAAAFKRWRSLVWSRCYEYLAEIEAGKAVLPQNFEIVRSMLPPLVWPINPRAFTV